MNKQRTRHCWWTSLSPSIRAQRRDGTTLFLINHRRQRRGITTSHRSGRSAPAERLDVASAPRFHLTNLHKKSPNDEVQMTPVNAPETRNNLDHRWIRRARRRRARARTCGPAVAIFLPFCAHAARALPITLPRPSCSEAHRAPRSGVVPPQRFTFNIRSSFVKLDRACSRTQPHSRHRPADRREGRQTRPRQAHPDPVRECVDRASSGIQHHRLRRSVSE